MRNAIISGKTKLCGIIGDPVEHSMSPVMHNAAYERLGLDYRYVPFRVKKEELGKAIDGIKALNLRGLNVTIPHKVAVIPLLDKLGPLAEKIGAVNTIVNDDGVLIGYNTDATGFTQALLEKGIEPKGNNVVVLGAGGASRAVSFALVERGAHLIILNRLLELDWAEELANGLSKASGREVKALELNRENLEEALSKADILVNATSVGMSPNISETLVTSDQLNSSLIVFDIVYNPLKTRLMGEAEAAGAKTISGLDMLVWQGALAFEKWTGLKPSAELMKKEAIELLKKHEN